MATSEKVISQVVRHGPAIRADQNPSESLSRDQQVGVSGSFWRHSDIPNQEHVNRWLPLTQRVSDHPRHVFVKKKAGLRHR